MQPSGRLVAAIAACLLALAPAARADIVVDLSWVDQNSAAFQRFKGFVDAAVGGNPGYAFSATDAAYMYRLTGQAQYATLAVAMADAQVSAAEAAIAAGQRPEVAGDQYLHAGGMIEDVALTLDWCASHVTPAQATRWADYAEQTVWNLWHHADATWGGQPYPWAGWGVNDPANNYHYSFLRATMFWGLATDDATWLNLLASEKWPEQLAYTATIPGGGSEEGTGYGLSHASLFELYRIWRDSTGADIGNANAHVADSIQWWIHATVPTRDRVAAIGDQARVSEPVIYDYHRHLLLEARAVSIDPAARDDAAWWLHAIANQTMESGFNYRHNLLPAGSGGTPPASLVHHASGTGQLFARTGWDTGALWLNFSAGPYTQSHAHQDQGSFTLFEGDWLAVTENIWTHSGIQQGTDTHNVLRFEHAGAIVPQRVGTQSSMTVTRGAGGNVQALADLTPAYGGDPTVASWQRHIDFSGHQLTVSDSFSLGADTAAIFQVNTPVEPIIEGNTAVAGALRIRVLSPANASLSALDWTTRSDGNETFHHGWRLDIGGATNSYMVEFSTGEGIFANGFEQP